MFKHEKNMFRLPTGAGAKTKFEASDGRMGENDDNVKSDKRLLELTMLSHIFSPLYLN